MSSLLGDRIVESLRSRTAEASKKLGKRINFEQVLKHYAANRTAARLFALRDAQKRLVYQTDQKGKTTIADLTNSASHDILIKGGMSLIWSDLAEFSRATSDIDVHLYNLTSQEEIVNLFTQAFALDLNDGCHFEITKVAPLEHVHGDHEGIRLKFRVWSGRTRIDFQADVGVAGPRPTNVRQTQLPTMFEGQEPRTIFTQTFEHSLSEKLHAILDKGIDNTRLKDYRDLYVLSPSMEDDALQEGIEHTFRARKMSVPDTVPEGLTDAYASKHQENWTSFLNKSELKGTVPNDLSEVVHAIRERYLPIFAKILEPLNNSHRY